MVDGEKWGELGEWKKCNGMRKVGGGEWKEGSGRRGVGGGEWDKCGMLASGKNGNGMKIPWKIQQREEVEWEYEEWEL